MQLWYLLHFIQAQEPSTEKSGLQQDDEDNIHRLDTNQKQLTHSKHSVTTGLGAKQTRDSVPPVEAPGKS